MNYWVNLNYIIKYQTAENNRIITIINERVTKIDQNIVKCQQENSKIKITAVTLKIWWTL